MEAWGAEGVGALEGLRPFPVWGFVRALFTIGPFSVYFVDIVLFCPTV